MLRQWPLHRIPPPTDFAPNLLFCHMSVMTDAFTRFTGPYWRVVFASFNKWKVIQSLDNACVITLKGLHADKGGYNRPPKALFGFY